MEMPTGMSALVLMSFFNFFIVHVDVMVCCKL